MRLCHIVGGRQRSRARAVDYAVTPAALRHTTMASLRRRRWVLALTRRCSIGCHYLYVLGNLWRRSVLDRPLLRILEEGTVYRMGDNVLRRVSVRLLAI